MLQETVSRLYLIASGAPHENTSQTHDQSSVHAFNILKAIFSDASLAGDLFSHLGRMVQLVITCFESASWAIRNAAAQVASEYCSFFLNFFYLYFIFFFQSCHSWYQNRLFLYTVKCLFGLLVQFYLSGVSNYIVKILSLSFLLVSLQCCVLFLLSMPLLLLISWLHRLLLLLVGEKWCSIV